jgi:hypothetical protein
MMTRKRTKRSFPQTMRMTRTKLQKPLPGRHRAVLPSAPKRLVMTVKLVVAVVAVVVVDAVVTSPLIARPRPKPTLKARAPKVTRKMALKAAKQAKAKAARPKPPAAAVAVDVAVVAGCVKMSARTSPMAGPAPGLRMAIPISGSIHFSRVNARLSPKIWRRQGSRTKHLQRLQSQPRPTRLRSLRRL